MAMWMPYGSDTLVVMRPRVLIVDEAPDCLDVLEVRLSGQGLEVVRAASGLEALRRARCDSPSVIVLEMMLPDLDGFAVCEILKTQPSTRDVPVVVLSMLERPLGRSRGSKLSVFEWLKKDSDLDSLQGCVLAALQEHADRVKLRFTEDRSPAAA